MSRLIILLLAICLSYPSLSQDDDKVYDRAITLLDEEKYEKALTVLESLVKKSPNDLAYRSSRAVAYFHLKQYKKSLNDYLFVAEEYPNGEILFQVGNIYDQLDSTMLAEKYYTMAIAKDQEQFIYYFKRGTLRLKREQWKESIDDFSKSLELNEEHANSFHNRGIAYYKAGFKERGCEDWCQALLKGSSRSASHLEKNCERYPSPCLLNK